MKSTTAKQFHNKPAETYRAVDKGQDIVINHDRYPDTVFVLSSRVRGAEFDNDEIKDGEND